MIKPHPHLAAVFFLMGTSPTLAQYVGTPSPQESTAPMAPATVPRTDRFNNLAITPKNGQTQQQMWSDRYECHRWAKDQSGFEPSLSPPSAMTADELASHREQYRRALTACLEGKGYAVRYDQAPPPAAAPTPAAPIVPTSNASAAKSAMDSRPPPLTAHIDGGYTITTGDTEHYLDGGADFGIGFIWFPTSLLPVGLRVDGSYSWFDGKSAFRDLYGPNTISAHENIYGGDVDLQLDLAHTPGRSKFYLLGGAGWYREQTWIHSISVESGTLCFFYSCEQGTFAVRTTDRITSPWRSSWNAGLGWESASTDGASFFIEARYLQIAPRSSKMQFVPIRVGLRF